MKKILCILLVLGCLCAMGFCAQAEEDVFTLWFEDGFGLSLPEGWVCYPVSAADAEKGMRYALGDADSTHFMYIQRQPTTLTDMDALDAAIEAHEGYEKTSELNFNNQPFLAFIAPAQNISACVTLFDGDLLAFIFTPQDDSAYMLTATGIMESFTT